MAINYCAERAWRERGRFAVRNTLLASLTLVWPVWASAEPQSPATIEPTTSSVTVTDKNQDSPGGTPEHWEFHWKNRPTLTFGSDTRIEFRARLQAHLRESEAPMGSTDSFDLSRRRIGVDGQIRGLFDFQVEGEIDSDESWRDVYINYRQFDAVQVQVGKFKLPFSLDENTSAANLDFVYRSRSATQLAPGRDTGLMLHGRGLTRRVEYQIGLFDHDGRNARTSNPQLVYGGRTLAGRVSVQPFRSRKSPVRDLQAGLAFTNSEVPEGIAAIRGRTALDESFFPADFWVRGTRRRLGLELRWRPGPASLKAEYVRLATERRGQSVEDTDLPPLVATGWYVSGTWLLTGERKSDASDLPASPLFGGGYGAIEVAGRLETLKFGTARALGEPSTSPRADVVLGNADRVATFGLNWHPVRHVKLQLNLIREAIADPSRGPLPDKPAFWSRVLRFQLSL